MPNFAHQILDLVNGEVIEGIVISPFKENDYYNRSMWLSDAIRPVQQWDDVADTLDYQYDDGYGGVECHAIILWTPTRVIFVASYDGSSWLQSVPRNPTEYVPGTVGGG